MGCPGKQRASIAAASSSTVRCSPFQKKALMAGDMQQMRDQASSYSRITPPTEDNESDCTDKQNERHAESAVEQARCKVDVCRYDDDHGKAPCGP